MQLIVLDRDGVINHDSDAYIKSPNEWVAIDGSLEGIAILNRLGYTVCIATNQSGVGRGFFSESTLASIHQKMLMCAKEKQAHIDAIFYCPHHPDDGCDCRKPKVGLFEQIKAHYQIELGKVYMVGDSLRDIEAARAAGAIPIGVLSGKSKRFSDIETYNDLLAFAQHLQLKTKVSA